MYVHFFGIKEVDVTNKQKGTIFGVILSHFWIKMSQT